MENIFSGMQTSQPTRPLDPQMDSQSIPMLHPSSSLEPASRVLICEDLRAPLQADSKLNQSERQHHPAYSMLDWPCTLMTSSGLLDSTLGDIQNLGLFFQLKIEQNEI